jgi:flagellar hook-associated protein 3 FlgL
MTSQLLDAALRMQAKTAELQLQQASGLVSGDYGGLGGKAKDVVNLEVSVARAQSYVDSATSAGSRIEMMYSATGSMVDLLSSVRSELTSVMGSLETGESMISTATEVLEEFSALLNTQYEGRYLFSGSRTDTPAVDTMALSAVTSPSTADTSYYNGDSDIASVRISNDQVVQYGATADNPAFEASLRALNLLKNMSVSPFDEAVLEEAQSLILEGLDGVLAVQTGLSLDAATVDRAVSSQQSYVDYLSSLVSDVRDVDIAAVAATMSAYEAQLQASYSALGRIQQLSLLNFL